MSTVENGLACAYVALLLVGTLGNGSTLSTVCGRAQIRSRTNLHLAQLALVDLLLIVCCVPLEIGQLYGFGSPTAPCLCLDYLQQALAMYSIFVLTLILVHAEATAHRDPLGYMEQISTRRALTQLAAPGLAIFATCLYVALPVLTTGIVSLDTHNDNNDDDNIYDHQTLGCFLERPRLDIGYLQVALLVCIVMAQFVIYLLYKSKKIFWPADRQVVVAIRERWAAAEAAARHVATHDQLMSAWRGLALNELKMIFLVATVHSLCWSPLIVGNLTAALKIEQPMPANYGLINQIFHLLAYTSSAVKPIIYACMSPDFGHHCFKRFLRSADGETAKPQGRPLAIVVGAAL